MADRTTNETNNSTPPPGNLGGDPMGAAAGAAFQSAMADGATPQEAFGAAMGAAETARA